MMLSRVAQAESTLSPLRIVNQTCSSSLAQTRVQRAAYTSTSRSASRPSKEPQKISMLNLRGAQLLLLPYWLSVQLTHQLSSTVDH